MIKMHYYVYILICTNNHYYTGYTNNLEKRYKEHKKGSTKCKYTRSFKPIGIATAWQIEGDKSLALKIEAYIKKLTREEKDDLIQSPGNLIKQFETESIIVYKQRVG